LASALVRPSFLRVCSVDVIRIIVLKKTIKCKLLFIFTRCVIVVMGKREELRGFEAMWGRRLAT